MYRALEDLVELVVDGEYGDLHELSRESLEVEDLHRRIEDDCPEALVLPPREHYGIEAIMKSDEPGDQGWGFFLDLWTEDGPATAAPRGRAGPVRRPLPRHAHRHPALTSAAATSPPRRSTSNSVKRSTVIRSSASSRSRDASAQRGRPRVVGPVDLRTGDVDVRDRLRQPTFSPGSVRRDGTMIELQLRLPRASGPGPIE